MDRTRRQTAAAALALLTLAALAGCSSLPTVPAGPVGAVALDRSAAEAMVSAYREAHGLSAVTLDPTLVAVAQRQADAMASANQLSHEIAGALPTRLASAGADRRAAIENVSAGYGSFPAALGGWERSPHHNENLLFPPMRRLGIAAAAAPGTRYRTFWSLVMTN